MAAVTLQVMAALKLRYSREALISAFEAMPADKQDWKPLDGNGRSARQLMAECALTNITFAEMVKSGVEPDIDWQGEMSRLEAMEPGALIEQFRSGSEELSDLIEAMPDEQLTRTFLWPWAEREVSFAEFAFVPVWHNDYHAGQINYIQTLYGDTEDHLA